MRRKIEDTVFYKITIYLLLIVASEFNEVCSMFFIF